MKTKITYKTFQLARMLGFTSPLNNLNGASVYEDIYFKEKLKRNPRGVYSAYAIGNKPSIHFKQTKKNAKKVIEMLLAGEIRIDKFKQDDQLIIITNQNTEERAHNIDCFS